MRMKDERYGRSSSSSSSSSSRGWDVRPKEEEPAAGRRWRSRSPHRGNEAAAATAAATAAASALKRPKDEPGFPSAAAAAAAAATAAAGKQEQQGRVKEEPRGRRRRREAEDPGHFEWGAKANSKDTDTKTPQPTLKPTFEPSGLLAEDGGAAAPVTERNGVQLKHAPPEDEHLPDKKWRLYQFKKAHRKSVASADEEPTKVMFLHRRSWFLFGKDQRVADILLLHPTVSKQHAVLQFRKRFNSVVPYLIDLESINGTYLNDEKVSSARYIELREGDTLRFGKSTREFVLLHSGSVRVEMSYEEFLQERDREKKQQQQE